VPGRPETERRPKYRYPDLRTETLALIIRNLTEQYTLPEIVGAMALDARQRSVENKSEGMRGLWMRQSEKLETIAVSLAKGGTH
jgi:hypothetical protein